MQFLAEMSMLDCDPFLRYLPSLIAASAVALANHTQVLHGSTSVSDENIAAWDVYMLHFNADFLKFLYCEKWWTVILIKLLLLTYNLCLVPTLVLPSR